MKARRPRFAALVAGAALLLGGCERGPDQGQLEVAAELRALRLALRDRAPASGGATNGATGTNPPAAVQVREALSPLRDALAQLGASQRAVSERQATLTAEMQRWTQLLVTSMQSERAAEAEQLGERLAALEQQIKSQDQRHREVEKLLVDALDQTSAQLEQFLQRVGAVADPAAGATEASDPPPQAPTGNGGEDPAPAEPGGGGAPAADPAGGGDESAGGPGSSDPGSSDPGGNGGDGAAAANERRASARWPWLLLAGASIATGLYLLRGRRRVQPVALAPEMRAAPEPVPAGPRAPPAPTTSQLLPESADEPEVEELWAAAALLGQAIGRLKNRNADEDDEAAPAHAPMAGTPVADEGISDQDLDELFVIDGLDEHGEPEPAPEPEHAEPEPEQPAPPVDAAEPPARPLAGDEPDVPLPRPEAPPRARPAPPASVHCTLPAGTGPDAEQRVRSLLEADPRVLISPGPVVQRRDDLLEVRFVPLPGLPAGERSMLEQRLRDAVA